MSKQVNRLELARRINAQHPEFLVKDLVAMMALEQEAIYDALDAGEKVKWGSFYTWWLETHDRKYHDNLHNKDMVFKDYRLLKHNNLKSIQDLQDSQKEGYFN